VKFRTLAVVTVVATFVLMAIGGYVKATGAGLACPGWPDCWGRMLPPFDIPDDVGFTEHQVMSEYVHRALAMVVGFMILGLAAWGWRAERHRRPLLAWLPIATIPVLFLQVMLGRWTVTEMLEPVIVTSHLATATVIYSMLLATAILAYVQPETRAPKPKAAVATATTSVLALVAAGADEAPVATRRAGVLDYVALTKPRIILLLVVTAYSAMLVAGGMSVPASLIVNTLVGGVLAAAAANTFNSYYDRDIDALMARTSGRPLPKNAVAPSDALNFGVGLTIAAFIYLWFTTNALAAWLAMGAIAMYLFFYTMWLKRRTPQNIVWGGLAGVFPPLVGWAAVTGTLTVPALVLAFIIFLWTPPHFWALALLRKEDYANAVVPMMPVVKGEASTRNQIVAYSVVLVASTLLLTWPLGALGVFYGASALVLGGLFLGFAVKLWAKHDDASAKALFWYSILYLGLLFAAMVLDVAIRTRGLLA